MSGAPWRSIGALVEDAAARFGPAEALVDGDLRLSFADLADRVRQAGRAIIASGVAPGERVAVWAPNIWEWVVAGLGLNAAGAVLVPVNTRFKGREAGYVLERAGVRLLFTVTDFLDTDYVKLLHDAGAGAGLAEICVLRGAVPEGAVAFAELLARADTCSEEDLRRREAAVAADSLCHVMFTSGTTGAPKGAMLAHGAVLRGYLAWGDVIGLREGDRYLIVNPFFHSFGLNAGILVCLMKGVTNIPHPVFDVPSVMARIPQERVTVLPGPPAIYQTILNHPDLARFDLSSLRLAVTGGAAIPVQLVHDIGSRLGFETVVTGYGLTECSGIATMCRHDDDAETIATTSGRAIPDVEVRIVDGAGVERSRGEAGEIVIRGYNVMQGYLDDPEQTAAAIGADGWLHSGDIGTMDVRGYVKITDRKKDLFIVGGFNAYPAEIENVLSIHPAVGAVAVVGMPDERLGEVGCAFVVRRPDATVSEEALIAWSRDQMANYKVPRRVVFVDALPMNAAGNKVFKDELRERVVG